MVRRGQLETEAFIQFGKVVVSLLILIVFLSLFSSNLQKTIVAEQVQNTLRLTSMNEGAKYYYYLPNSKCELKITRDEIIFDKKDASFWRVITKTAIKFVGGFIILNQLGIKNVGAAVGSAVYSIRDAWYSIAHAKEELPNPVGYRMKKDSYIIDCQEARKVKIEFYNENGQIDIRWY